MQRVTEPELMDDEAQARAYAEADFEEPNSAFVGLLGSRFGPLPERARVIDLGCGPADIAIRLACTWPGWTIDAVDGSEPMLALGRDAAQRACVADRVRLIRALVPSPRLPASSYDIVLSNSLLHHLQEPAILWKTIWVVLARKGAKRSSKMRGTVSSASPPGPPSR